MHRRPVLLVFAVSLAAGPAARQAPAAWRLVTPEGHTLRLTSAAFSPDGHSMLTVSGDATALIWDVASGRELQRFDGVSAAFSPDGRSVVIASGDHTVRIWDVASGHGLQQFTGHTDAVNSAAFSPDGRSVVTASDDHTARIWDVASGRELQRFTEGGDDEMKSAAFSPDGLSVLILSDEGTPRIWDVASGREQQRFTRYMTSAAFSPDGRFVVAVSLDSTVRVWDVASGRELQRFTGYANYVESAAYSPDGRSVVTASWDGTARIRDVASGRELQRFIGASWVQSAAFSPDGRSVVTASGETARIWDVASGRELVRFTGHTSAVNAAAFSPDGRSVVIANGDHTARIWDMASGHGLQRLTGHTDAVNSAAFSPDGRSVVTASTDHTARIWDVASGRELQRFSGHAGEVTSAAFSPDGRSVVTASYDATARVWDVASGRELQRFTEGGDDEVTSAAFSPDGRSVVTASYDDTARIWDVASGRELQRLTGHTDPVESAAFSPDGRSVVTASGDHTARIWDATSGRELQRFIGAASWVQSAAFSPNGRSIVTASGETARLWDVASGRELQRFTGHRHLVRSAAFSPDGHFVVTASWDNTVRLWTLSAGSELLRAFALDSSDWVAVAPDGRFDGTEGGMREMYYSNGLHTTGLDAFFETFYSPGLTDQLLAGRPYVGPDIRKGFGLAPSVRILSPLDGDTVQATVTVAIAMKDQGGGAEDVRLYHNGALVGGTSRGVTLQPQGCPASATCFPVELLPGTNTLEATAFSTARVEAERARVVVTVAGTRPTATLHLIVVGINTYQNPRYSLNYGHPDAKAFVDSLLAGGEGIFSQVVVDSLYDAAATSLAIKAAFRRAASSARPQDLFVFFYAGHGIAEPVGDSTRFYLVPTDVTQMSDPEQLAQRGIANLQELFDAVPARKKLMLIDACQSGQAIAAFAQRGEVEEQAIARLARASGIFVMSAAGSDQVASEVATLGHGVFTYAWLQAMARETGGPRERLVGALASEVERTIPELSRRFRAQPQYPIVFRNGQDFPLLVR